jgi:hypothetical protein
MGLLVRFLLEVSVKVRQFKRCINNVFKYVIIFLTGSHSTITELLSCFLTEDCTRIIHCMAILSCFTLIACREWSPIVTDEEITNSHNHSSHHFCGFELYQLLTILSLNKMGFQGQWKLIYFTHVESGSQAHVVTQHKCYGELPNK